MDDHLFFYLDADAKQSRTEQSTKRKNQLEGIFLLNNDKIRRWEELKTHCIHCLDPLQYCDEFDASYCSCCDEWRETICDPDCQTCQARPAKPSECRQDFE